MLDCRKDYRNDPKIITFMTGFYNLIDFYDNLLKPVMYEIGQLWIQGKLDIATEHVCSNTAQSLIGIINERKFKVHHHKTKILLCTPNGELHSLGCKVIESFLISKGFKVFNISPSVQAASVISYIQEIEPDVVFISISLATLLMTETVVHCSIVFVDSILMFIMSPLGKDTET